jgi:glucose-1-phosphate thymidylyltransferase
MKRVGIILAGGTGSRLFPLTYTISKQLLPIYDKPMIYYSLSILMLANIREILLITTSRDLINYKNLLGNGSRFGIKISYKVQKKPRGLAEAFILGEKFIKKRSCALVLGDNLFYGSELQKKLLKVTKSNKNTIFGFRVSNPKEYGVIEFNNKNKVISIQEKPVKPKSNYAAVGLYFYNNEVCKVSKNLKPSKRGELEITDLNNILLKKKKTES